MLCFSVAKSRHSPTKPSYSRYLLDNVSLASRSPAEGQTARGQRSTCQPTSPQPHVNVGQRSHYDLEDNNNAYAVSYCPTPPSDKSNQNAKSQEHGDGRGRALVSGYVNEGAGHPGAGLCDLYE